jgi:hypothetical protein
VGIVQSDDDGGAGYLIKELGMSQLSKDTSMLHYSTQRLISLTRLYYKIQGAKLWEEVIGLQQAHRQEFGIDIE